MKLSLSSMGRLPIYSFNSLRNLSLGQFHLVSSSTANPSPQSLYRRISPLGNPNISVVPVLDQWVEEGNPVDREEMRRIIKELRFYKRYKHALEISQWMSDKRYMPLSCKDIAARLNLIMKVHGLEEMENYFNNLPTQMKGFEVHIALLNCYANAMSIEKAELLKPKMEDLGFNLTTLTCTIMMNLYYKTGKYEKIDALELEMKDKGISYDQHTFGIRLNAYAAISDVEGINRIIRKMEFLPRERKNWNLYAIAANGYLQVGQRDKALSMMKKIQKLSAKDKRKNLAFNFLLKMYARLGMKDELYSIWSVYKKDDIYNKGFHAMISSLIKMDDIDGAEKIFKEWESSNLSYDIYIPKLLVDAYCKEDLFQQAETFVKNSVVSRGISSVDLYYSLAGWYLKDNRIPEAVRALKETTMIYPNESEPSTKFFTVILEFMEGKGNVEVAEKCIDLVRAEGILSVASCDVILNQIKGSKETVGKMHGEADASRNLHDCEALTALDF